MLSKIRMAFMKCIAREKGVGQHGKLLRRYWWMKLSSVFGHCPLKYLVCLTAWYIIWWYFAQYLMPFVEKEGYQISSSCRLHHENDLYRDQEQHKIHVDINEWRCGYCKKSFYAENYLDKHFDNRHYNLLNVVCSGSGVTFLFLAFRTMVLSSFRNGVQSELAGHVMETTYPALITCV